MKKLLTYEYLSIIRESHPQLHQQMSEMFVEYTSEQIAQIVESLEKLGLTIAQIEEMMIMNPGTLEEVNAALYKEAYLFDEPLKQKILGVFKDAKQAGEARA